MKRITDIDKMTDEEAMKFILATFFGAHKELRPAQQGWLIKRVRALLKENKELRKKVSE